MLLNRAARCFCALIVTLFGASMADAAVTSTNVTVSPTPSVSTLGNKFRTLSDGTTTVSPTPPPGSSVNVVTPPAAPATTGMVMGMNLGTHAYYSSDWAFADVMKKCGGWAPRGTAKTIKLDANGWPLLATGEIAQTIVFSNIAGHYPGGTWRLTYEGSGTVDLSYDAKVTSRSPGVVNFTVNPTNLGILLQITSSAAGNPVRNIRFFYPHVPTTATFHPKFLETIRPFGVIRFMQWQNINAVFPKTWDQRARPTSANQTGTWGVSVEHMVQLCNELNSDPWFCIPHTADDNYVRQFAALVKAQLRKDRKVYVEWTNEPWNWAYPQGQWVQQQSQLRKLSYPQVMGDEARRVFRLWHEVWGAEKGRVVRVAAGQQHYPWVTQTMLERLNGEFDAVSCTAYFLVRDADAALFNSTTKPDQILNSALKQIDEGALPGLKAHADMAKLWSTRTNRKIPLVCYEGGQHITPGSTASWFKASLDAQRLPKMGDAYRKMLDGAKALNVQVLCAYNAIEPQSQYGAWGGLEYQDSLITSSPKHGALLQYTTRR